MQAKNVGCFFLALVAGFVVVPPSLLKAAVPTTFTYQGSLKQNGSPVNGTYPMEFKLTNQAGTDLYWASGPQNVEILEGLYRVDLNPVGVDWANVDPYIETRVNGTLLLPREKLNASAYAALAKNVPDGAIIGTKIAPLAVTNSKINDVSAAKVTGQIVSTQIANGQITSAKIGDGQITSAKLDSNLSVTSLDVVSALQTHGINFLKILQVVQGETTTPLNTFSTSFVNTNLSVQITPTPGTSSGSKFLIFVTGAAQSGGAPYGTFLTVARNGVNVSGLSGLATVNANAVIDNVSLIYFDAPSTTVPINYSVQARSSSGAQNISFPSSIVNPTPKAIMIVVEVAQ